jgi:hypothetical protein
MWVAVYRREKGTKDVSQPEEVQNWRYIKLMLR